MDSLINLPLRKCLETPINVSIGAAYSAGDQVGDLITIPDFFPLYNKTAELFGTIFRKGSSAGLAFILMFFNEAPTLLSVDNAPLDISDADMQSKFIGSFGTSGSSLGANWSAKPFGTVVSSFMPSTRDLVGKTANLYLAIYANNTQTFSASNIPLLSIYSRES